jgi:hypothetical protein
MGRLLFAAVRAGPLARNDDVVAMAATKQPAGQIGKKLSSPSAKNVSLNPSRLGKKLGIFEN